MKAVSSTLAAVGCLAHILSADPAREENVQEPSPPLVSELADEKVAISSSGQFQVSGGESLDRATAAMLADQAREEFVALTADEATWKIPVSIKIERAGSKSAPSRISQIRLIEIEGAKRLEILYPIRRSHFHEELKRAVTSAILYELALLNEELGDLPMSVPPWLSDGLREATAWRQGRSDRRLYEAIFYNGGLFRLDDLLGLSEVDFQQLDGASLAAFRVSSGALVMALMAQPDGQSAFASFLREAAAHQGEMALLLRRHFPGLSLSKSSLAKWWSLQLAVIGGVTPLTEVMTVNQSEQQLEQTLEIHLPDIDGTHLRKPLSAWEEIAALEPAERLWAVRPAQEALTRLSYRCFPLYRPLLLNYQQALNLMVQNETDKVNELLTNLDEQRAFLVERATRASDYLDWFEITRARETSGAFDDYLSLRERLRRKSSPRRDPVSRYLDKLDQAFRRDTPPPY